MSEANGMLKTQASTIKNKIKRAQVWGKQKAEKKKQKQVIRKKRKKEAEELGVEYVPAKSQKTLDNTREIDETLVQDNDEEVKGEEEVDEFAKYFKGDVRPKVVITSCHKPTKMMYTFIRDLLHVIPNSFYYKRNKYHIKEIVKQATEKEFTDIIIINENRKKFNGLTLIHLPGGPTAYFKLSSVMCSADIPDHGAPTSHRPEVMLNNFSTRLGHRVGRMLGALFHQEPNFRGRRVAVFHNQRDFIFFRHHRYIFDSESKARLQEIGPRFTLKLKWLQHGTFDTQHGEYEWMHQNDMDTSRRRFFL